RGAHDARRPTPACPVQRDPGAQSRSARRGGRTRVTPAAARRHNPDAEGPPQLGLRANWRQFTLLVLVNAFVGAMVGLERTVLPLLARREFGVASVSAALSFIVTFGVVKAATNLLAGRLSDRWGRKRVLVLGWLFALLRSEEGRVGDWSTISVR